MILKCSYFRVLSFSPKSPKPTTEIELFDHPSLKKMQRLVSLKLASNLPKKFSSFTTTTTSNSSLFHFQPHKTLSLSKTHTQNHFFTSFPTHPLLSSWSSQQHTLVQRVHGFLSNPLLLLRGHSLLGSSNTLLRVSSNKLSHFRLAFLQRNGPKQNFQFIPCSCSASSRSSWFQNVSTEDVLKWLVVANGAVFGLWCWADTLSMYKHFAISHYNFTRGCFHTLVTSAISHIHVSDLVCNMSGLVVFGTNIGRVFGPEFLLKMYVAGAVGGSVFYLAHQAFLINVVSEDSEDITRPYTAPGVGAGGAVTAIILLDMFLRPTAILNFMLGTFYIVKDIPRIMEWKTGISGSTYLGGATVAVRAWARLRKGRCVF